MSICLVTLLLHLILLERVAEIVLKLFVIEQEGTDGKGSKVQCTPFRQPYPVHRPSIISAGKIVSRT